MLVMNPELMEKIRANKTGYIFLEPHDTIRRHWKVNSFDVAYLRNLEGVVDNYGSLGYLGWGALVERCKQEGYQIVFMEDPSAEFEWLSGLDTPVGVDLLTPRLPEATEEGFLPFQRQGINFAKDLRGCVLQWSTGTGKTVGAVGSLKWHEQEDNFDICVYVVKTHNKVNAMRSILKLVGLNSVVVDGTPKKREKQYIEIAQQMKRGEKPVMVCNYEKFRDDKEAMLLLTEGKRVLFVWDEMPSKLKNHEAQLWKAVAEVLYTSFETHTQWGKTYTNFVPKLGAERQSEVRHLMLSAFPIYNGPLDWFNCVHLMDPSVYTDRKTFMKTFSDGTDPWGNPKWNRHKLPLMGSMAAFMTHQVDKEDPDIAAQFPKVVRDPLYVELSPGQRKLYDALQSEYANLREDTASILEDTEILSAINCLQLICSMPISVLESAKEFEHWVSTGSDPKKRKGSEVAWKLREKLNNDKLFDVAPAKLLALKDDLEEHEGKMVIFTKMTEKVMPHISRVMDELEIDHVQYHGGLSTKQKQASQDRFRETETCKVFLASDAGQDSIDLPEADWVGHYDLPPHYVGEQQRENRAHRLISEHDFVTFRRFICENTVEDRLVEIIDEKFGYHVGVFKGKIAEQSQAMRRGDLLYLLSGNIEFRGGDR